MSQMYKPTYQQMISRSGSSSPNNVTQPPPPHNVSPGDLSGASILTQQSSLSIQAPLAPSTNSTQSLGGDAQVKTPPPSNLATNSSSSTSTTAAAALASIVPLTTLGSATASTRPIRKITLKKVCFRNQGEMIIIIITVLYANSISNRENSKKKLV